MKFQILMTIAISTLCAAAQAGALVCDINPQTAQPVKPYRVVLSPKQATVVELSANGETVVADLLCKKPENQPQPCPDCQVIKSSCTEPKMKDGGFRADLMGGGFSGLYSVKLYRVSIAGLSEIAELPCQAAPIAQ